MVHVIVHRERHAGIHAIDRAGAGVDQVTHLIVPATFQQVGKADDVGVDVGVGVLQGIAHSRLRRQVDHRVETMLCKQGFQGWPVNQVDSREGEARLGLQ